jgi:RNA polymerase sigma factor (TIGR02999 family)
MNSGNQDATRLLERLNDGDAAAAHDLLPLVYDELRALAGAYFRRERPDHTLQPTALVHEAFLKLIGQTGPEWKGRAHFLAVAATAMRHTLVNHALAKKAAKRGGGAQPVLVDVDLAGTSAGGLNTLELDQALKDLAALDERKAKVVEMRFFGGMTIDETAAVLNVSVSTVEADWRMARAWLSSQLSPA